MTDFDDRLVGVPDEDLDDDDVREGELDVESLDDFRDDDPTVVELAFGQRSWRFGHVIVDEAQDLTPMQWRMILRRARGRSMTIVGDLAQRTTGPVGSWSGQLPEALADVDRRDLTINYRSPAEINRLAARLLRRLAPDLPPSRAIRESGEAPALVDVGSSGGGVDAERLLALVEAELAAADPAERVAVIGLDLAELPARVERLRPSEAKGLEFDVVIVVDPVGIEDLAQGASLLYIALTRSIRRLVVAHDGRLPAELLADED